MIRINFQQTYFLIKQRAVPMLDIALVISIIAALCFITLLSWSSMTSPDALDIQRQQQEYFKRLEQEANTPAKERAWKRLHRKHGEPGAVIYEPGKEPYYVNAAGQKCRFI